MQHGFGAGDRVFLTLIAFDSELNAPTARRIETVVVTNDHEHAIIVCPEKVGATGDRWPENGAFMIG